MNEIRLKAKCFTGEACEVVFAHHDDFFTLFCPCQAGVSGTLCKHKTQFLQGDQSMLDDPSETTKLTEIRSWAEASKYASLLKEHAAIRNEIDAAKRKEQKFRRTLEEAMRKGIPFAGRL